MSALLAQFWPHLVAAGAALVFVWRILAGVKKAGINQQKAEEAKRRDENLRRIREAAAAGARIQPDNGLQSDEYNRDR